MCVACASVSRGIEKCSSNRRGLFSTSADFLYSVYGTSCAPLKVLLENSCASPTGEAGRQHRHEDLSESATLVNLNDQKVQDLPLDIRFRLSNRQPDLVGSLSSSVQFSCEEGSLYCIPAESDTALSTRVRRLQRQCAVALMNCPGARLGVSAGRKGGRRFLDGLSILRRKRRRFRYVE